MKRLLISAALLAAGACTPAPPADVIKALAADPNSLCWTVQSVWVTSSLDRNHGCPGNVGAGGVLVPVLNANGTVQRFEYHH